MRSGNKLSEQLSSSNAKSDSSQNEDLGENELAFGDYFQL